MLRPLTDAATAKVALNLLGATGLPAEVVARIEAVAKAKPAPGLALPGLELPGLPLPGVTPPAKAEKKEQPAVASNAVIRRKKASPFPWCRPGTKTPSTT